MCGLMGPWGARPWIERSMTRTYGLWRQGTIINSGMTMNYVQKVLATMLPAFLTGVPTAQAMFRTDPAKEGVLYRWYLADLPMRHWRTISVNTSWASVGALTDQGRPYTGIVWYRGSIDLESRPEGKVSLFFPELPDRASGFGDDPIGF